MGKRIFSQTDYVVQVNGKFIKNFDTLSSARRFIEKMNKISSLIIELELEKTNEKQIIEIIKRSTTYSHMNTYEYEPVRVLVAKDLDMV